MKTDDLMNAASVLLETALDSLSVRELIKLVRPEAGSLLVDAVQAMQHEDIRAVIGAYREREKDRENSGLLSVM